ncbi:hypothetical protein K432DRAFT_426936 [Lepidopterella palustris CBS 459.81]|uniref:Uncharacterized protein n=1 Tax=Lepidopterella palustris CBS 459.81 TaxID=1314670 RepID=A0A8E2E7N6_9PEZI|nr:hypothetical protein K432DRAFT_426936 [Lepidopterella palustris CBS 459.81]
MRPIIIFPLAWFLFPLLARGGLPINQVPAPDITVVQEGFSLIAKLPCISCPFFMPHPGKEHKTYWSKDLRDNVLLLNITMTPQSNYLLINGQKIYPLPSELPKIYASQRSGDISIHDLRRMIENEELDFNEKYEVNQVEFGISYDYALFTLAGSSAIVLHFDVIGLFKDLPDEKVSLALDIPQQQLLEVVLLQKPIISALEPPTFEIVRADLVPRDEAAINHTGSARPGHTIMQFLDWDDFGRKGSFSHGLLYGGHSFALFFDSDWIIMIIAISSMIAAAFAIYAIYQLCLTFYRDDYEYAQQGKAAASRRTKGEERMKDRERAWEDEEKGLGVVGIEELRAIRRGHLAGVTKHD